MKKIAMILTYLVIVSAGWPQSSYSEAVSKADSLLKAKKHFSFAVQYKNSGSFEQAADNYRQSIAYNDTVYQVHYSFADLLMKMEKPLEARREYSLSLSLNPQHFESATMLARLYYETAEYDSALAVYTVIHRMKPDDLALLESIAGLREYLGKKEDALDSYRELIARGGGSEKSFMQAVTLASELEKWDIADSLATQALAKNDKNADILRLGAAVSTAKNDPKTAITRLRKLAEIDADNPAALVDLEKTARAHGDSGTLAWALERHLKHAPSDASISGELVEMLFKNGNEDQALIYLKQGIAKNPENGRLRVLMGNYYREKGQNDNAIAEYEHALRDETWKASAQQFIWQIRPPKTEDEKAEQEFFSRGKKDTSTH